MFFKSESEEFKVYTVDSLIVTYIAIYWKSSTHGKLNKFVWLVLEVLMLQPSLAHPT